MKHPELLEVAKAIQETYRTIDVRYLVVYDDTSYTVTPSLDRALATNKFIYAIGYYKIYEIGIIPIEGREYVRDKMAAVLEEERMRGLKKIPNSSNEVPFDEDDLPPQPMLPGSEFDSTNDMPSFPITKEITEDEVLSFFNKPKQLDNPSYNQNTKELSFDINGEKVYFTLMGEQGEAAATNSIHSSLIFANEMNNSFVTDLYIVIAHEMNFHSCELIEQVNYLTWLQPVMEEYFALPENRGLLLEDKLKYMYGKVFDKFKHSDVERDFFFTILSEKLALSDKELFEGIDGLVAELAVIGLEKGE